VSDGIDPQLFVPDVGGEVFERPLELDLVLRITAGVELNGLIIPLGDLRGISASAKLDPAFLRDEVRSMLTELLQRFGAQDELNSQIFGIIGEVSRKGDDVANLIKHELSRILGELASARAALAANTEIMKCVAGDTSRVLRESASASAALAANTEIMKCVADDTSRLLRESEMVRAGAAASNAELVELRKRLEAACMRSEDLEQSWSWRVTAPARFFLGWFRK
jgi:hypothetical protein